MKKTLPQSAQEFTEAWRVFVLALAYSLKINVLLDKLTQLLNKVNKH